MASRFQFWVDIAGDVVPTYDPESPTLRTFRVYVFSFDEKEIPPAVKQKWGTKSDHGQWDYGWDAHVEYFSTNPAAAWSTGDRIITRSILAMPYKWIVSSNLPRQSAFFMALTGWTELEITTYGLSVLYTSTEPLAVIVTGWTRGLEDGGKETLTIAFAEKRRRT